MILIKKDIPDYSFIPTTATVKVVKLDPARLEPVATYVPA